MKGRKNGPSSCEMDSSEVFELGNDSLYKFHRPLLISLSLYEESRIRKVPAQDGRFWTRTALGYNPSFGIWKLCDLLS